MIDINITDPMIYMFLTPSIPEKRNTGYYLVIYFCDIILAIYLRVVCEEKNIIGWERVKLLIVNESVKDTSLCEIY